MVSFHVMGHHWAITQAAEAGCVRLIKPHPEKLREYSERTVGTGRASRKW